MPPDLSHQKSNEQFSENLLGDFKVLENGKFKNRGDMNLNWSGFIFGYSSVIFGRFFENSEMVQNYRKPIVYLLNFIRSCYSSSRELLASY